MLKKIRFVLSQILILYLFSIKGLYAQELFVDDFNYRDDTKWNYKSNSGQINFINGVMDLSSTNPYFPYVTNSAGKIVSSNDGSILEFKFNYKLTDYMGDGMGMGYTGLNGYPYYQISLWNDLTNGLVLQYQDDNVLLGGVCNYSNGLKKIYLKNIIVDNNWHVFRIEKHGSSYKVLLDSSIILITPSNQCSPTNLLIGNPLSGGRNWWTKLSLDYVKIFVPTPKNKIVVIPGLGASWNPQSILMNTTVPSNQWTMTPFVKNYDLLISGLNINGLVKNQDYYVWNYDWRKSLPEIVNDFNKYINSLGLAPTQKVDLVGHSLGGLTARLWTQDNSDKVSQVITLGSPHYGSVKAYEAWNGAKISDNLDVASIGLNVLLQIQKKNNDTSVQTLRSYAPIVFDLSPTFTFLKRGGTNVIGKYSQYLMTKNNNVTAIIDKLSTIDGKGVSTMEWINLGDRSLFDKVLGIWEDGRPLSYINNEGDGTVLKKSALILGSENVEFSSNHGAIVDKSTNWVLTKLGLGITVGQNVNYPQKQSIFYSDSPALMKVNCNGVEKNETSGWVIMDNQDSNNCQISMIGNTSGTYHVAVSGNQNWQYFEGSITENQPINIVISGVDAYWQMLKQDFVNIGAINAANAVDQRNVVLAVDEYIKFRQNSKNFRYSEEILENMRYLLNMNTYTETEINNIYVKAISGKSLVETNLRLMSRRGLVPKYSDALNYEQANNLMNYGKNYAANYIAGKLYGIVWK